VGSLIRKSEIESVFKQLHGNGINTLGSLIIGWDSQTKDIASADSKRFIALNSTFYQVVPLHIVPGTALWQKMKNTNRISENYQFESDGITDFNFVTQNLPQLDALELVYQTYFGLVETGGPWPFRMFERLSEP